MYYIRLQEDSDELNFYCRNCGYVDEILNQESMCLTSYDKTSSESGISNSINSSQNLIQPFLIYIIFYV